MKNALSHHINSNKKKYMFLLLSFIFGMLLGYAALMIFSEKTLSELEKYLSDNLKTFLTYSENLEYGKYFLNVLASSIPQFLLLWLVGLAGGGVFFPPAFMAYKGYVLAFTFALILNRFDGKGLLFDILVLVSQNIIKIPSLMFASMCAMSHSLKKSPGNIRGRKPVNDKGITLAYSLCMIISFMVYTAGIFVECYVIPHFVFIIAKNMI